MMEIAIKNFQQNYERNKGHVPGNSNKTIATPYDTYEKNINVQHLIV